MENTNLHLQLKSHLNQAKATAALLYPYAEVVIHDLSTRKIINIFNPLGNKQVGDSSELEIHFNGKNIAGPFVSSYENGKKFKSVATVIRDNLGKALAVQIINIELNSFINTQKAINSFINVESNIPSKIHNPWQIAAEKYIQSYLKQYNLNITTLTKEQKIKLIHHLSQTEIFKAKHAATFIGKLLGVSRATIYKYISSSKNIHKN